MSVILDQFYTREEVASQCYSLALQYIPENEIDIFLEPSAGKGSFYRLLPYDKRLGIDLDPKYEGIEFGNYFDFRPNPNMKYCVIGNPPFGRVCSTAIKFFNHSAYADYIAFIIPKTFKRISVQNKLSMNFHLIFNFDLPLEPCCFEPKMNAKCCFQIWKKTSIPRTPIRLPTSHPHWIFMSMGPKDSKGQPTPPENAHFAIKAYGSHCGVIQTDNLDVLRPKSWHWIYSNIPINELIENFNQLDYSISKDTVRQESLGRAELVALYSETFDI